VSLSKIKQHISDKKVTKSENMPGTSDIDVLRCRQHGSLVQLKETREAKGLIVQAPGAASSILGRCRLNRIPAFCWSRFSASLIFCFSVF
jgi:hypothetical protein